MKQMIWSSYDLLDETANTENKNTFPLITESMIFIIRRNFVTVR